MPVKLCRTPVMDIEYCWYQPAEEGVDHPEEVYRGPYRLGHRPCSGAGLDYLHRNRIEDLCSGKSCGRAVEGEKEPLRHRTAVHQGVGKMKIEGKEEEHAYTGYWQEDAQNFDLLAVVDKVCGNSPLEER